MLIEFRVSNFRSFGEETAFSLLAGTRDDSHSDHLVRLPAIGGQALRTSVIYGANGAGKSNLFRAMRAGGELALADVARGGAISIPAFAFSPKGQELAPTRWAWTFSSRDAVYGYEVSVQGGMVREERLFKVLDGTLVDLFTRHGVGNVSGADKDDSSVAGVSPKSKAQMFVGVSKTRTVLSVLRENIPSGERGDDIDAVVDWFSRLLFVGPDAEFGGRMMDMCADDGFRKFADDILDWAAGVAGIRMPTGRLAEGDLRKLIRPGHAEEVMESLRSQSSVFLRNDAGSEVRLERDNDGALHATSLQGLHAMADGRLLPLDFGEESDGTKRLLQLLPALYSVCRDDRVCVIDELDRSMHAILSRALLRKVFAHMCRGQLILTTHESSLLDVDLFRRDEIWFAEKDSKGMTRMYSLNDYKKRTKATVRDYYLEGRYGATPPVPEFEVAPSRRMP